MYSRPEEGLCPSVSLILDLEQRGLVCVPSCWSMLAGSCQNGLKTSLLAYPCPLVPRFWRAGNLERWVVPGCVTRVLANQGGSRFQDTAGQFWGLTVRHLSSLELCWGLQLAIWELITMLTHHPCGWENTSEQEAPMNLSASKYRPESLHRKGIWVRNQPFPVLLLFLLRYIVVSGQEDMNIWLSNPQGSSETESRTRERYRCNTCL